MKKLRTKKGLAIVLAGAISLAGAGATLAYFTSTGSGTGNAIVGSSTAFTINNTGQAGPALLPGSGTDTVTYTVTNPSTGAQNLSATSAALTKDANGGVFDTTSNAFVDGCLASWFSVSNAGPTPVDLAGGATAADSGTVSISLNDSGGPQDPCEGLTPQVTISAS